MNENENAFHELSFEKPKQTPLSLSLFLSFKVCCFSTGLLIGLLVVACVQKVTFHVI